MLAKAVILLGIAALSAALVIEKADREFDLSGHLLKIEEKLLMLGSDGSSQDFEYVLSQDIGDKVIYFEASSKSGDKRERLTVTENKAKDNKKSWKIKFATALGNNERVNVVLNLIFTEGILPFPKEIKQSEKQKVLFTGNVHMFSPYTIKEENVKFTLASNNVESYTKTKPVSQQDNTVTYGPYEDVKPFSDLQVSVHFENNKPFLVVRNMKRIVDVSLWGSNIAIEEHYEIYHSGAILNGPFSRYDYQIHQDGVNSIKSFKTVLPAAARDIYYRDEIGNISTSNVREMGDAVEVEIRPRFPLFGGWKTVYYIGYNIPAHQFLYRTGGHMALKMPFVDHVYDDQLVEDFELKVILPESSEVLKFFPPYSVERKPNEAKHVFFDFTDSIVRPIFVATGKNLVEQHIQDFTLEFNFRTIYLLRQPMLFTVAFLALFLTVIVVVRMDFAITRDQQEEARMKASSHSEAIMRQVKQLQNNYSVFSNALQSFKATKDSGIYQLARKKAEAGFKAAQEELSNIRDLMKGESVESAEKVNEVMKCDSAVRDALNKFANGVEKFVNGKTDKARFANEEEDLKNSVREAQQKVENAAGVFA